MKLLELAQSWPHEGSYKLSNWTCNYAFCRRCQVEQWARDKNSELRARSERLKEETPQDFKDGWFTGVMSVVHDDLGVPDDEIRRERIISKFRKKPVEIEAIEVRDWEIDRIAEWCGGVAVRDARNYALGIDIPTREGTMRASLGDFVIKGIKGEFYPCKPDIFEATYEEVK